MKQQFESSKVIYNTIVLATRKFWIQWQDKWGRVRFELRSLAVRHEFSNSSVWVY